MANDFDAVDKDKHGKVIAVASNTVQYFEIR